VITAPGHVRLVHVADPEPGPGQVQVAMEGAGICASELPVFGGRDWFDYPRAPGEPGHEGWGRVRAVGPGVSAPQVGQRVAMISQRAHAELDVADADHVVALDEGLPVFPGEPFACAVNAVARAGVTPGARVVVIGCGFQGLALIQLCAGIAGELTAVSRRRSALALAADMGATSVRDPEADDLPDAGFDVVFEATGHQAPLDVAARLCRVRGRLVIVGYHQDGRRSVDMALWNWRGLDVINAHERDPAVYVQGLRGAIRAVTEGRLLPDRLLTHEFAFEDLQSAYETSARRPDGFVKAVWRHA
jgi:threonine dehydrogenase-like Zn-dependent dehydrogenase